MKPETREGIRYSLTVFLAVRLGLLSWGWSPWGCSLRSSPSRSPGGGRNPSPTLDGTTPSPASSASTRCGSCGSPRAGTGSATAAPPSSRCTRWPSGRSRGSWAGHPFAAALLVSNASFAGALCVLYALTASGALGRDGPTDRAVRRAVPHVLLLLRSLQRVAVPAPRGDGVLGSPVRDGGGWPALPGPWPRSPGTSAWCWRPRCSWRPSTSAASGAAARSAARGAAVATGLGTLAYLGYWGAKAGDWLAPRQPAGQLAAHVLLAAGPRSPTAPGTPSAPGQHERRLLADRLADRGPRGRRPPSSRCSGTGPRTRSTCGAGC